jgi:hypothetical protein
MPTNHRLRLDNEDHVEQCRIQSTEPDEGQTIDVPQPQAPRVVAAQHCDRDIETVAWEFRGKKRFKREKVRGGRRARSRADESVRSRLWRFNLTAWL